ncbi:MAG: SMI1/KNR4 family protein, partial [Cytophagaceae bacterium]
TSPQLIGWPEELLGIGDDPGGNSICIAFKGLRPGAIFYWRENGWQGEQNLYLIADSFDDFVGLLRKELS